MHLHAKSVSASIAGDYYQVHFSVNPTDAEGDPLADLDDPYLLIQTQFEFFRGNSCFIESHDEQYIGHFPLKLVELSANRLAFEIVREKNSSVEVTFSLGPAEFEEVKHVTEVIFGLKEPSTDSDDDFWAKGE